MAEDKHTVTTIFENIKGRVKYLKTSEPSGFETEKALCEEIERLYKEVGRVTMNLSEDIRKIHRELKEIKERLQWTD
jgi:hypothetical protein